MEVALMTMRLALRPHQRFNCSVFLYYIQHFLTILAHAVIFLCIKEMAVSTRMLYLSLG